MVDHRATVSVRTDATVNDALHRLASALDDGDEGDLAPPRDHSWRALVAVAAAIVVGVVLLDVRIELGRTPASAESTRSSTQAPLPPSSRPATSPAPTRPAASAVAARRFAWAPVDGAGSYRVELFRGEQRVFSATVARPQATVPARWTFDGQVRSLDRGEYRWYVWPIVAGKRASTAVVQAKLVVP